MSTKPSSDVSELAPTSASYVPAPNMSALVANEDSLAEMIASRGVAILPNVLTPPQVMQMRQGQASFLETITQNFDKPIDISKKATWKSFYDLSPMHGMLIQHWGIGHAQYIWDLRQNESIVNIFRKLWSTDDLLVSFDGAAMSFPHETTNRGYYRGTEKFHLDQRLSDPSFQCVQSWVTAYDVRPGDATLTVLEGSNNLFEEFSHAFNLTSVKTDWYQLSAEQIQWYKDKGCVVRDITCRAGSMVAWDSRTVHSGKPAIKDRERPNFRSVAYLCYTPRAWASEANLKKKRQAFVDKRTTSHWPHRPKLFPKAPQMYGKPLPNVQAAPDPVLTDMGRRLAGFD